MNLPSYPKIYNVGHSAIKDIFIEDVLVEEKIDGSQFSFSLQNNELVCRSKGKIQHIDAPDKLFEKATESVKKIHSEKGLHPEWIYSGEYLQKPKHNSLCYNRIPNNHIILFDIRVGDEDYLSYDEKKMEVERLGLEIVPKLFYGKVESLEHLKKLLETESILGKNKIEGVVVKNYKRFGTDGKALMAKIVSDAFKEVHKKSWKIDNPASKDILQQIIDKYKTNARWEKADQHLKEDGKIENSPRDISVLIKEVRKDVEEECSDEIKEMLFRWAWKQIGNKLTGGLPEWYKNKLMEDFEF